MRRMMSCQASRLRFDHGGDDDGAIRPGPFHLGDLAEIDFERTIGDQLDVVDGEHPLAAVVPGAVAIRNVQHRRADGLPDGAAPAGFERAVDLRAGVGRRRRGQPERIRRADAREVDAEISHVLASVLSRAMNRGGGELAVLHGHHGGRGVLGADAVAAGEDAGHAGFEIGVHLDDSRGRVSRPSRCASDGFSWPIGFDDLVGWR